MRDLIISAAVVVVLIGGWLSFDSYSEKKVEEMAQDIAEDIIPSVEAENWEKSMSEMEILDKEWHDYKRVALLFLGTDDLNDIDYGLSKVLEYVEAQDVSNSAGELSALAEQLTFLNTHEKITLVNIF